jgi:hypothetical protein
MTKIILKAIYLENGALLWVLDTDKSDLFVPRFPKENQEEAFEFIGGNQLEEGDGEEDDGQPTEQKEWEDVEGIEQEIYSED